MTTKHHKVLAEIFSCLSPKKGDACADYRGIAHSDKAMTTWLAA